MVQKWTFRKQAIVKCIHHCLGAGVHSLTPGGLPSLPGYGAPGATQWPNLSSNGYKKPPAKTWLPGETRKGCIPRLTDNPSWASQTTLIRMMGGRTLCIAIHEVCGERVDETKQGLIRTKARWEEHASGGPDGGERRTTLGPVTRLYWLIHQTISGLSGS